MPNVSLSLTTHRLQNGVIIRETAAPTLPIDRLRVEVLSGASVLSVSDSDGRFVGVRLGVLRAYSK